MDDTNLEKPTLAELAPDDISTTAGLFFRLVFLFVIAVLLSAISQVQFIGPYVLMLLGIVVPFCVTLGLFATRGESRVFVMGTILPAFLLLCNSVTLAVMFTFQSFSNVQYIRGAGGTVSFCLVLLPLSGMFAVGFHRLTKGRLSFDSKGDTGEGRFQFSLKTMVIGTTACAAFCAVMFGLPYFIATGVMAAFCYAVVLVFVAAVFFSFSRKDRDFQIFLLGAAVPVLFMLAIVVTLAVAATFGGWSNLIDEKGLSVGIKVVTSILFLLAFAGGKAAVYLFRRLGREDAA